MEPLPLFGRETDLQHLLQSAGRPGLTIVHARPLMGKSRLASELCDRLRADQGVLVGLCEHKGQHADQLLRAIQDAFRTWALSSGAVARLRGFLKLLRNRQRRNILEYACTLLIDASDGSLERETGKAIGIVVKELAAYRRRIDTADLDPPKLDYQSAINLLGLLHELSEGMVVLVLDAIDQSPDIAREGALLTAVLKHLPEGSGTHIVVTSRDPSSPFRYLRDQLCSVLGAEEFELGRMQLGAKEQVAMLKYLRDRVPACNLTTDDNILSLMSGCPGVLASWLGPFATPPETVEVLASSAASAHEATYPELESALANLSVEEASLAMRLSLLPTLDRKLIAIIGPSVFSDADKLVLKSLAHQRLIFSEDEPIFGHETRHYAMRQAFLRLNLGRLASELRSLMLSLMLKAGQLDEAGVTHRQLLAILGRYAEVAEDPLIDQITNVALLVSGYPGGRGNDFANDCAAIVEEVPEAASFVAVAYFDHFHIVIQDESARNADIVSLKELYEQFGSNALVRLRYAKVLVDAAVYEARFLKFANRDRFFRELASLYHAHADDPEIAIQYAKGLRTKLRTSREESLPSAKIVRFLSEMDGLASVCGTRLEFQAQRACAAAHILAIRSTKDDPASETAKTLLNRNTPFPEEIAVAVCFELGELVSYLLDLNAVSDVQRIAPAVEYLVDITPDDSFARKFASDFELLIRKAGPK